MFTKKLIQYINSTKVFTLSIDFPSGLFGDKSVTDTKSVLKARHVLTFQTPKMAFLLPENKFNSVPNPFLDVSSVKELPIPS